jgi:Domain of unknown function (DUF2760)
LSRVSLAFRSFFGILFGRGLPESVAKAFGYQKEAPKKTPSAPLKVFLPSDGALQILGILQRDARLIDFLMEDISGYSDEEVGGAVRDVHQQCSQTLKRYVGLQPVIDGVEGTFTKLEAAGTLAKDTSAIKLLGNVPANGKVQGGTLRHKGWRAEKIDLPALIASQNTTVLAPAEIEVE